MGGHYALVSLENHVYAASIFARNYRLKLVKIRNLQKRLYGRIGQWVEALHKTWNVVT